MDWKKFGCFVSSCSFFLFSIVFALVVLFNNDLIGKNIFPINLSKPRSTTLIKNNNPPNNPTQPSNINNQDPVQNTLHISVDAGSYYNDADFQNDGVAISIRIYNPYVKPNTYSISNTPIRIQIYGFSDVSSVYDINIEGELVFERTYLITNDSQIGDMFGMDILIPFEEIDADRSKHYQFGRLVYSIVQGGEVTYRNYWNFIQLYE